MSTTEMLKTRKNQIRRARLNAHRDHAQRLLNLADLLSPADRILLLAHFDRGLSVREIAQLHRATPRQTRRRLEMLARALNDPLFPLAHRFMKRLPGELPAIARRYWFEGAALRDLARERGESLHRIRQHIQAIRSILLAFDLESHQSPRVEEECEV